MTFNEGIHFGANQSIRVFTDVGKMIGITKFWRNGFSCENIIILCFYLQMLKRKF